MQTENMVSLAEDSTPERCRLLVRFHAYVLTCLVDTAAAATPQEMSILEEVMEEAVYALGDEAFGILAQV
jgi:hypothetical protein